MQQYMNVFLNSMILVLLLCCI